MGKWISIEVEENRELNIAYDALRETYGLLQEVVDGANKNNLSLIRKLPACGAGMYLGRPAINIPFDELIDKHAEALYNAFKAAEITGEHSRIDKAKEEGDSVG